MGDFGERLKKSRKARNFTMLALGKKVGVAKSTIAGYESGFRTPSLDVIVTIATTLNLSTDYLLGLSEIPAPPRYNKQMTSNGQLHWDGIEMQEEELEEMKRILEDSVKKISTGEISTINHIPKEKS